MGDRSKYICIPHKVKEAGIHFVWDYLKGIPLHVPENMGFLHHYRNGCESHNDDAKKNCADEKYVEDKHLYKFKLKLLKNVETVWRKMSKNCNLYPWWSSANWKRYPWKNYLYKSLLLFWLVMYDEFHDLGKSIEVSQNNK